MCPNAGQPTESLCQLTLSFFLPIPKTCRKKDGSPNYRLQPTPRKDIDNLSKAVMDVLSGPNGYYVDDSQVVKLIATKEWTEELVGKCVIKLVTK